MRGENNKQTILDEINGAIRWHLLNGAVDLELFDLLSSWTTAEEVAAVKHLDAAKAALFLDALTACGYVDKFAGRYINTLLAQQYLNSTSELYQGSVFRRMSALRLRGLDQLPELLRGGDVAALRLEAEAIWARASEHLIAFQKSIAAPLLARLDALGRMADVKRVLDLGCGPGHLGLSVKDVYPHVALTLLDLPAVMEKTRDYAAHHTADGTITFTAGNYNRDDLGGDYDLVIAARSLYYAEDLQRLMAKLFAAMRPGGVLLCVHEGLYNERTAPADVVISRIGVALRGSDVSLERGAQEQAMQRAGFRIDALHNDNSLGGNSDLVVGVRP